MILPTGGRGFNPTSSFYIRHDIINYFLLKTALASEMFQSTPMLLYCRPSQVSLPSNLSFGTLMFYCPLRAEVYDPNCPKIDYAGSG